jgi:hypothetical protein
MSIPSRCDAARARVAVVTALSMLISPVTPLLGAQAPAPPVAQTTTKAPPATASAPPATPTTSATPASATAPAPASLAGAAAAANKASAVAAQAVVDGGWPRAYTTPSNGQVIVYQPQVATWEGQKHMVAYAAVSYLVPGTDKPALGSVRIEADTKVAVSDRLVSFSGMILKEANFPTLPKENLREVTAEIDKAIPDDERVIALDRVLASFDKSQLIPKNVEGVKADPPTIFYSERNAILVNLDGDPIWSPIKDNDLKFAVNTNWDLFQHGVDKHFYLRNNDTWLKTADLTKGPWQPAGRLPESFGKLPKDDNWKDVLASLPGKGLQAAQVPTVYVSTTPAEMLLLRGAPSYVAVGNTKLLWVNNTESDVFRLGRTGAVYYLVAGRWFSAPDFKGPWTFATPNLPADFQQIPLEHPRSRVLASVPGTQQAAEAVLLAQVPQTARVNKKELKAPEVAYQGDPKFEPIPSTSLSQAVNTDKDIIKVGDMYYMCFQGVWFMGSSPQGPWTVASSVPGQIYEIPVSSPVHNVTYVTVEDDNDSDEWVTFVAAAGYTGMMVAWGCAVWGTGYYYPPYWGWYGGYYPYYYPRYPTYGYGAWYNPWSGAYGRTAVAYGPYGGAGVGARYNPTTGTYARGAAAWGPYGARGVAEAYNPRTGTYAQTRQGSGVYGSWGSTAVQRGDQWAQTSRVTNRYTGTTTRVTQGSGGGESVTRSGPGGTTRVARTGEGDVYAGHDGNVYKKTDSGWQKYENGSWTDPSRPQPTQAQRDQAQQARDRAAQSGVTRDQAATQARDRAAAGGYDRSTIDQLNRDASARSAGTQRTRDYGSYRSSGGSSRSAGTYRPSGGGMRGGGGRRR